MLLEDLGQSIREDMVFRHCKTRAVLVRMPKIQRNDMSWKKPQMTRPSEDRTWEEIWIKRDLLLASTGREPYNFFDIDITVFARNSAKSCQIWMLGEWKLRFVS